MRRNRLIYTYTFESGQDKLLLRYHKPLEPHATVPDVHIQICRIRTNQATNASLILFRHKCMHVYALHECDDVRGDSSSFLNHVLGYLYFLQLSSIFLSVPIRLDGYYDLLPSSSLLQDARGRFFVLFSKFA